MTWIGKERVILFLFKILFIFRERGREGERERSINVSLPFAAKGTSKRCELRSLR